MVSSFGPSPGAAPIAVATDSTPHDSAYKSQEAFGWSSGRTRNQAAGVVVANSGRAGAPPRHHALPSTHCSRSRVPPRLRRSSDLAEPGLDTPES